MKLSTIRLITVLAAVAVLAIIAVAVSACSTGSTSPSDGSTAVPSAPAASGPAVTSTCQLGWVPGENTPGNAYPVPGGKFHAGSYAGNGGLPSTQKPFDAFQVSITNNGSSPVSIDWVNTDFYLNGQQVGSQTQTANVPDTIQPGRTDSSWSTLIVPNEAGANWPKLVPNPNTPMENDASVVCQVNQWGNAAGS